MNVFFPIQFPIHDMTDEQEKKWDGEGMGLVFRSSAELQKSVSPGRNRDEDEKFVLEELLKVKRDEMDWKRNMLIAIAGGRTPRGQRYGLSHDSPHNEKQMAKITTINKFHVSQLAYLMTKLKEIPEGDGTLLDHCMIAYGSGCSDGLNHNHDDLPILLAGGGCGTIKGGRHIRYPKETPLNNLWMAMLDRVQLNVKAFGDSTGSLPGLNA